MSTRIFLGIGVFFVSLSALAQSPHDTFSHRVLNTASNSESFSSAIPALLNNPTFERVLRELQRPQSESPSDSSLSRQLERLRDILKPMDDSLDTPSEGAGVTPQEQVPDNHLRRRETQGPRRREDVAPNVAERNVLPPPLPGRAAENERQLDRNSFAPPPEEHVPLPDEVNLPPAPTNDESANREREITSDLRRRLGKWYERLTPQTTSGDLAPPDSQSPATASQDNSQSVNQRQPSEQIESNRPTRRPDLLPEPSRANNRQSAIARSANRRGSKTANAGGREDDPPSAGGVNGSPSSFGVSERLLESLIDALDTTSRDIVEAVQDPNRRQDWSWVFNTKRELNRHIPGLKRQMSRLNNYQMTETLSRVSSVPERLSQREVQSSDFSTIVVLSLGALAAVLGWVAYQRRSANTSTSKEDIPFPRALPVNAVVDRDTLVGACHQLSVRQLGASSRYRNHRSVFRLLAANRPENSNDVDRLARLYECSRYAPRDFILTRIQLEQARESLVCLEGGTVALR